MTQFGGFVTQVTGYFYMYLMNNSKITRDLFLAVSSFAGVSYIGKSSVEAVKEVEIQRANAKTKLDLQNQLVEVQLKNYETKKKSFIAPLIEDYKFFISQNPFDKDNLMKKQIEILNEIKQGPPFIYE
ncbi:MAG: hypothetical protein M0C28_39755 [Candidatus Moduliflexus flocculans]|nr:hypothetical protein [Candidatus Moduliflexus flocculans]